MFLYEGRLAGRVQRARVRVGEDARWVWTIFINRHVPQVPNVPISGTAVTLDEAVSQFKRSYEAMRAKAGLSRNGDAVMAQDKNPKAAAVLRVREGG